MANLQCKYGQSSNLSYTEISDGTVYVCKDTLDVYADIEGSRLQLSSNVSSDNKISIKVLTEDEYNALASPDESTLYIIKG